MRSEEKWDFRDVILQTFARTKMALTVTTAVALVTARITNSSQDNKELVAAITKKVLESLK